jgi:hypothetical protein
MMRHFTTTFQCAKSGFMPLKPLVTKVKNRVPEFGGFLFVSSNENEGKSGMNRQRFLADSCFGAFNTERYN